MKCLLRALAIALVSATCVLAGEVGGQAGIPRQHTRLFRIKENEQYGFINQSGKVVIKPQYRLVGRFSEGLAPLRIPAEPGTPGKVIDGKWRPAIPGEPAKWGYIDTSGKMVIPAKFAWAYEFSNGLGRVGVFLAHKGKRFASLRYGFVNRSGKVAVEPKFQSARDFSEGLAAVSLDGRRWGFINTQGRYVVKPVLSLFIKATPLIPCFSQGLAQVGPCAFINRWGRLAINLKLTMRFVNSPRPEPDDKAFMRSFSEGLAPIRRSVLDPKRHMFSSLWGFADKRGRITIKAQFDNVRGFAEGLAAVRTYREPRKWGYIDPRGRFVIKPQFDAAGDFSEGLAYVSTRDGLGGYVNKTGKIAFELPAGFRPSTSRRSSPDIPFRGGLAGDDGGYIDKMGRIVWQPRMAPRRRE